jgi:hypothetical protein
MKKLISLSVLTAVLLLGPTSAHAVWYQVEMIVFENLYPDADGEDWYRQPGLTPLENTVPLKAYRKPAEMPDNAEGQEKPPEESFVPYEILPESNNRLEGINRVLRLSREYRPVYHVSWQQPGLDGNQAKPVHVQAREQGNLFELTLPPELVTDPMPLDFYEPVELIIDGALRIRSSLYLYVDLDMVLFRTPPVTEKPEPVGVVEETSGQLPLKIDESVEYVRLTESRRIRLNELHYFDHPLFGVILQVSRYGPE